MRYPTQRLYDRSAERNVGHEVPVHHIHVNAAGSGLLCLSDLFTQPSEVGSEYRRSQLNPVFYHFRVFTFYIHDVAHGCPTGCPPYRGSEFSAFFTIPWLRSKSHHSWLSFRLSLSSRPRTQILAHIGAISQYLEQGTMQIQLNNTN